MIEPMKIAKPWSDTGLSLGKPACMDTDTLIEWIQRQLETEAETRERHDEYLQAHRLWHELNPGIWACCITASRVSPVGVDGEAMARAYKALGF